MRRRKELSALIEWVFNSSHGTYGYRRVHAAGARRGVETSPETVRSIMREQGPPGRTATPKGAAPPSPPPGPGLAPRPGPARAPAAGQPGVKWVGDITYIRTWEGFVYLATVPGCCTKKAVGYAIGATARGADSVVRGDRYGGAQVPAHDRRDGIPLGPGVPVHLRAVLPASGEI